MQHTHYKPTTKVQGVENKKKKKSEVVRSDLMIALSIPSVSSIFFRLNKTNLSGHTYIHPSRTCKFANPSIGSHRDVTIKWVGLAITPYPYPHPRLTATTPPVSLQTAYLTPGLARSRVDQKVGMYTCITLAGPGWRHLDCGLFAGCTVMSTRVPFMWCLSWRWLSCLGLGLANLIPLSSRQGEGVIWKEFI